jgi:hypothetical protein
MTGARSRWILSKANAVGRRYVWLSCEELVVESCGVIRVFFREEVATFHRLSLCARSPLTPGAQRTAVFGSSSRSGWSPDRSIACRISGVMFMLPSRHLI